MWDLGGGTAKHWEKLWLHVFSFCFFFLSVYDVILFARTLVIVNTLNTL